MIAHNDGLEAIAKNEDDLNFIYGKTFEMKEGVYREVRLYFSHEAKKLVLCSSQPDALPKINLEEES